MARTEYEATPVAAHGVSVFAGIMLIMGGAFQVIEAIVAIANDEYLLVLRNYVFSIDLTGYNEQLVKTPSYGSDPAWSPLME